MTKDMINLAYAEGCRHLFLTPHARYLVFRDEDIKVTADGIRKWVESEGMDLKIYLGAEISVRLGKSERVLDLIDAGIYPTMNDTDYVLIEPDMCWFFIDEIIKDMQPIIDAGYKPIIAHAERYGFSFEDLCRLKEMGCRFQMNLCDLYYHEENDINRMTRKLLSEKMYDFVGTDSHRIERRPPIIKEYTDYLYTHYDKEYIDRILYKNAAECLNIA